MLLPLQLKHAGQRHWRIGQGRPDFAAADVVGGVVETAGRQCLLQRQDRRQWFVFDHDLLRRRSADLLGLANHQRHNLAVEPDLLVRQQGFVVLDPPDVVLAGHVFCQEHRTDAGHRARHRGVAAQNPCMGVRGADWPNLERPGRLVIRVKRLARDVLMRTLVRQGAVGRARSPLRAVEGKGPALVCRRRAGDCAPYLRERRKPRLEVELLEQARD